MAKFRAVIEADSGTPLVDFPQGIYALYEKLRSVSIRHSPSNIPIADEEDGAIRVKLYAEDDVGKRLTLLFSEDNTLAEVNTTAFVMENTDPEIRPQLEENLLHGQYASFQELIDDVREMTYALGSVRRSYFCPLRGSVDDGEYEDLCDADNRFLRDYAWAIQEKLEEDQAAPEAAMAQFFHDDAGVKAKLVSAVWNVEGYRGQLYGKIECRFKEQLTEAEEEIFRKWISGQCSDGYYGFESAIPQITSEMFGDMLEFDTLNKLAAHIAEMSDMVQVTFKAALTAEKPQGIREALDIAEHLQEYELSYYTNAPAAFFKNYLQHYLDTRFDGRWLDMLPAQKEGEQLLGRLGATDTEYGVISARGHSLYEPVLREEPEAKKLKTQALTDEKLDVIEVLGRRALFCNGRLLPEEIPEGLYAYDLRYSDEKGQFISIEPKVGENHGGTILLRELLDFREQGHLSFTDDTSPNFLGYGLTPREFMETGQAEEAEEQTMEGMQL